MTDDTPDISDATRRTVLKAIAGGTALAGATGTASAHEFGSDSDSTSDGDHDHTDASQHDATGNVDLVGYHSLGDVGPSSESGSAVSPHYGALSEIRVHGDYAYVSIFSSKDPTNNRGLAIIDISEFNAAETPSELEDAELEVISFLRNDNDASAVMDVKVSDDGDYVFISKQPYTVIFEETDPTPSTDDDEDTSVSASALQAVDVSDPTDPTVVGTYDVWDTGPHNAWHHVIDGTDYIFAIKDLDDGTAAMYVFEFERTTGALVLVNQWDLDGNLTQAEIGDSGTVYIHDVVVQDDPKTETPTAYVSYWGAGVRVLDVSNPTNIDQVGRFLMDQAHYAEPAPTLLDGKRVFIGGQETPSSDYNEDDPSSGRLYLVDADGIYEDDGVTDLGHGDGAEGEFLDQWTWKEDAGEFGDFTLSPHNFNITEDGYVHLGHYHGGTRFLQLDESDWTLSEKGYFQAAKEVPEDSKMTGLNHAAPFTWAAVEQNGVTFASDINTGVYALRFKPDSSGDDLKSGGLLGVAGLAGLGGLLHRHRDRLKEGMKSTFGTDTDT